ncbi:MAG TPA: VWA domain-containing protein [Blastocatellia bacterium]|nr:VWA domain-containing protein [Blastocatellia bacterium]
MLILRFGLKLGLLPLSLLLIGLGLAQNRPAREELQQETIRLDTNLVVIDAQVLDRKTGSIINGLTAQDFDLYEDGQPQPITHFSQDKLSLSVVLLIDLSGSVSPILNEIRNGALAALQRLKEQDEVAVMAFSDSTQLIQGFTTDRQAVVRQIDQIEKTPVVGQGTMLYQALRDAAHYMNSSSAPTNRRVIITMTDNISWDYYGFGLSEQELMNQVIESGSMVSGLIVEGSLSKVERIFRRGQDGKDVFRRRMTIDPFANQTGGEIAKAATLEISARLAQLIDHLRTRYSLGFSPKRELTDGGYRQIKLVLTPAARKRLGEVIIKTKQGYFAKKSKDV